MSTYQPVTLFTSTEQPRPLPAGLVAAPFGSLSALGVLIFVSAPLPRLDCAAVFTTFLPDFGAAILSSCAILSCTIDWLAPNNRTRTNAQINRMYMVRPFFFIVPSGTKVQIWWHINKNKLRESKIV